MSSCCRCAPPLDIDDVVDVTVGDAHTCVLRRGGTVLCWGLNNHFELGNPGLFDTCHGPIAVQIPGAATG
jgi:alpha-tubulin suppressor-like RCC1 family protein